MTLLYKRKLYLYNALPARLSNNVPCARNMMQTSKRLKSCKLQEVLECLMF